MNTQKKIFSVIILFALATPVFAIEMPDYCGTIVNSDGFGPFDYMNPVHRQLHLPKVEGAHFTPAVEQLRSGKSGEVWSDIAYVLRRFPNHHRALYSMMRYQLSLPKPVQPWGFGRHVLLPMECYFLRALKFKPTDSVVYGLYGLYFYRIDNYESALSKFQRALEISPDSAELNYNIGLLYFEQGNYDAARKHAEKAYAQNYPLAGLKNKLKMLEEKK